VPLPKQLHALDQALPSTIVRFEEALGEPSANPEEPPRVARRLQSARSKFPQVAPSLFARITFAPRNARKQVQLVAEPRRVLQTCREIDNTSPVRFPNGFLEQFSTGKSDRHLNGGTTVPWVVFLQPHWQLGKKFCAIVSLQLPYPSRHDLVGRLHVMFR
jgi:hypothetical protein